MLQRVVPASSAVAEDAAELFLSPVNSHNEWDPLEGFSVGGSRVRHPLRIRSVTCNNAWAARLAGSCRRLQISPRADRSGA